MVELAGVLIVMLARAPGKLGGFKHRAAAT